MRFTNEERWWFLFEKVYSVRTLYQHCQWRSFVLEIPSTPSIMQTLNVKEKETFGAIQSTKGPYRS